MILFNFIYLGRSSVVVSFIRLRPLLLLLLQDHLAIHPGRLRRVHAYPYFLALRVDKYLLFLRELSLDQQHLVMSSLLLLYIVFCFL